MMLMQRLPTLPEETVPVQPALGYFLWRKLNMHADLCADSWTDPVGELYKDGQIEEYLESEETYLR